MRPSIRGFTLIEAVIYFGLLSILLTGAIETLASVSQSTSMSDESNEEARSAAFLADKIDWAFSSARDLSVSGEGSAVTFRTGDSAVDPIVIAFDPSLKAITLSDAGGPAVPLTSSRVSVDDASFARIEDARGAPGLSAEIDIGGVPLILRRFLPR